jgi:hypothetical protein
MFIIYYNQQLKEIQIKNILYHIKFRNNYNKGNRIDKIIYIV